MEQLILSLMPLDLTCRYRYHNHDNENQVPKIDSRKVQQSQQFTLPAQALKLLLLGLLEQHIRTCLYVSQSAFRIKLSTVAFSGHYGSAMDDKGVIHQVLIFIWTS